MNLLKTILDIVFPNSCLICKNPPDYLCEECLSDLPRAPISEHNFIISIFNYRNKAVKDAVWLLKYRGKEDIARIFAGPLYEKLVEELADLEIFDNFTEPIFIPIPLSAKKLKERGFNQSAILAEAIIGQNKNQNWKMIDNALEKTKETIAQAKIKERDKRLKNLSDCFSVSKPELTKGRNIILIDDVSTTGATILEAKKVLEKSGARKVIALTIAH